MAVPDAEYNPVADARAHLDEHRDKRCRSCAVWTMLLDLWALAAELYERREQEARVIVLSGRRKQVAKRLCRMLSSGGLSHSEIARVIDVSGEGTRDRIRKRIRR